MVKKLGDGMSGMQGRKRALGKKRKKIIYG